MQWHDITCPEGRASLVVVRDLSRWAEACLSTPVTEADRQEAARFTRPSLRLRWLASRAVTRMALAAWTGIAPETLLISRRCAGCGARNHGKPWLNAPGAPEFNLSHSGESFVLAISPDGPIGIDIERGKVTQRELSTLGLSLTPNNNPLENWIRAEAALKAVGLGLAALQAHPDGPNRVWASTKTVVLKGLMDIPIALSWAVPGAASHLSVDAA